MTDLTERLERALADLRPGENLTLGASDDADVRVEGPDVSALHAEIVSRGGGLHLRDLDSDSGTFIDGAEVLGWHPVQGGQILRLGDQCELSLPDSIAHLPPRRADDGMPVTLSGITKSVSVGGPFRTAERTILDDITLHIEPGEFVGILGASGSGKSTFIRCIAGLIDVTAGQISIAGQAESRHALAEDRRIAYMPQDVVIHELLSPRRALGYVARLKGIGGGRADRNEIIRSALDRVGLGERLDVPIHRLSGGQRKRVALASELLGDPKLLLLDEATSGLDPATEADMMRLFRSLADEGRSVVCITHFPGRLELCDRIVFLMEGKMVFVGTPAELKAFFGVGTIEDVYGRQGERSAEEWLEDYRRSATGRQHAGSASPLPAADARGDPSPHAAKGVAAQAALLTQRYFDLLRSDWRTLILMFAQAPIIALMAAAVFGNIRFEFVEQHAANTGQVIFVLVLAVLWCAGTLSVREIVKEESILRHEIRFGLNLPAYLASKLALLSFISVLQTFALLWILRYFTELTGNFVPQFIVLSMIAVVGVLLGLVVSSIAGGSDRAMTVLPVVLIAQAILSGGLATLDGIVLWIARLLVPAYWGMDGLRATFGSDLTRAGYPGAPGEFQPPILGSGGPLALDLGAALFQGIVLMLVAYAALNARIVGRSVFGGRRR